MIRTGSMTEQIVIQYEFRSTDGQGGYTATYPNVLTRWAHVKELSYDRIFLDGGIKFTKVCEFTMRNDWDGYTMTGRYRISWNNQLFTVHSVVTNDGTTTVIAYVAG